MASARGDFLWYELATPAADAAAAFYAAVIGWGSRPAGPGHGDYRMLGTATADVAGMLPQPGRPARWLGTIGVDDVDRAAGDILRAGGHVPVPPADIPGGGRVAQATDPDGAAFQVMQGNAMPPDAASRLGDAGQCHWRELTTRDQAAALAFYAAQFGWTRGDAMPMGDLGDYRFLHHGERMFGAMMNQRPGGPPPAWCFYFGVPDIDLAAAAIHDGGGSIHQEPIAIPGGAFSLVAGDPQGAVFGLVGPRRR